MRALAISLLATCGALAASCSSAPAGAPVSATTAGAGGATGAGGTAGSAGHADAGPKPDAPSDDGDAPLEAGPDADAAVTPDAGDPALVAALHARADDALQHLLLTYWNGDYLNGSETPAGDAGYWIFAQAFDAVLDGVERTSGAHYAGLVRALYDGQQSRGFSRDFFDDENWMTLALVRAFDLTGDSAYLDTAKTLFADIRTQGWDATCCGAHPGGIWWDRAHTQKATASNAGPVLAAVRLAKRTGDASYRSFAKQVYGYWAAHLVNAATHQVADHLAPDGTVTWWKFTYDDGLMVGAGVELGQATGSVTELDSARAIAAFMVAKETTTNATGRVLSDGTNVGCGGDCAAFKGIGVRYLADLYRADPTQAAVLATLTNSGDSMWASARSANGLFATDWAGPTQGDVPLAADASATMALNVVAGLAGPYVDPHPAPGTYQAEEATLHHVGLEAKYAGFDGWGYVAGWNHDGQSVDFTVNVATAGSHAVDLRYAAGAGAASRVIRVNGATAIGKHAFASTGAWGTYASTQVTVTLPAGASTVSVAFDGAKGSAGYLNLDALTVHP